MLCEFEPAGQRIRCKFCGREVRSTNTALKANCGSDAPRKPAPGCCEQPALPSLPRMAWNYATSTAEWIANGAQVVSEEQYNQRKAACRSCPQYRHDTDQCSVCGCYIAAKASRLTAPGESDCPLGIWPVQLDQAESRSG